MSFVYPALPVGVDAIRILKIEAGDFMSPIVATLSSRSFSDRPKYVALSYTWRNSYPENANLPVSPNDSRSPIRSPSPSPVRARNRASTGPEEAASKSIQPHMTDKLFRLGAPTLSPTPIEPNEIVLNGGPFSIGHNLQLALLHLRSPSHAINIWIDAICINQADTEERNHQVSLMSFIYTRATKVVAWLGTKDYPPMTGLFRSMSLEWKAGQTHHFGASLAGVNQMRYSPKPDQGTLVRILESTYWRRVWIVQEMCLPRVLVFVYGSDIWTYQDFKTWALRQSLPFSPDAPGAASRLLEIRQLRHTDMMRFESLVERFAKSDCSELRDRVYGLLGCANDIQPFAGRDERADTPTAEMELVKSDPQTSSESRRGIGFLRVDYKSSFYKIWTDVVSFVYFRAKTFEHNADLQEDIVKILSGIENVTLSRSDLERQLSVVRTAGIVQGALGQNVDGLASDGDILCAEGSSTIEAIGYIAGEIEHLGPDYISLVGSSSTAQHWTSYWVDQYDRQSLETWRWMNEEYTARILGYEQEDLDRIRYINDRYVLAHPMILDQDSSTTGCNGDRTEERATQEVATTASDKVPRICLGTAFLMGLVPPETRVGDVIVRFWNCSAAIVMRPTTAQSRSFVLVGRADVAQAVSNPSNALLWAPDHSWGSEESKVSAGAVSVRLNPRTLQKITAHISTQPESI